MTDISVMAAQRVKFLSCLNRDSTQSVLSACILLTRLRSLNTHFSNKLTVFSEDASLLEMRKLKDLLKNIPSSVIKPSSKVLWIFPLQFDILKNWKPRFTMKRKHSQDIHTASNHATR